MIFPEVSLFMITAVLTCRVDSNLTYLWFPLMFTAALRIPYGSKCQHSIEQLSDPAELTLAISATL